MAFFYRHCKHCLKHNTHDTVITERCDGLKSSFSINRSRKRLLCKCNSLDNLSYSCRSYDWLAKLLVVLIKEDNMFCGQRSILHILLRELLSSNGGNFYISIWSNTIVWKSSVGSIRLYRPRNRDWKQCHGTLMKGNVWSLIQWDHERGTVNVIGTSWSMSWYLCS